jgi:SAM-dependent methyltransferase
VTLNPAGHYADDRNFRARQRLWQQQAPMFDTVSWVLSLTEFLPGMRVLDAGCGNGLYLRALAGRAVRVVGCDLSMGMLRPVGHPVLVNADVTALPIRGGVFDVVLATHMLYHVPDREAAVRELRRVLASGGTCVAVTNGARHMLSSAPSLSRPSVPRHRAGRCVRPRTRSRQRTQRTSLAWHLTPLPACVRP